MNKNSLFKTLSILVVVIGFCVLFKPEKPTLGSPMLINSDDATLIANQWAITYGKADSNHISDIIQTSDGGFLIAAWTEVDDSDNVDGWILKLDQNGAVTWHKRYGGSGLDTVDFVVETSSGNFVVAGWADLLDAGSLDVMVMNLNPDGTIAWQKTYGGDLAEYLYSMEQTSDGGFILGGGAGGGLWVLKLNSNGDIQWQKIYVGSGEDGLGIVRQTSDNGYILLGYTYSFGEGQSDIWVLKLNSDGSIAWQKTYGGTYEDYAYSIQETSDGAYILGGQVETPGGEVGWIAKLDGNGVIIWEKFYGDAEGFAGEAISSVYETSDGGIIVTGYTYSFGAGLTDAMIFKINSDGMPVWQKAYGGDRSDYGRIARELSDGSYIFGGQTHSFGAGGADIWVLKVDAAGNIGTCNLMTDMDLIVSDSAMTVSDTSVIAQGFTAVASTSTFVLQNETAQSEVLCPLSLDPKCYLPVILK